MLYHVKIYFQVHFCFVQSGIFLLPLSAIFSESTLHVKEEGSWIKFQFSVLLSHQLKCWVVELYKATRMLLILSTISDSRADKQKYCALCEESMTSL